MNNRSRLLLIVFALGGVLTAQAETQYVGERILLGVYEQPGSQGRRLTLLKSADQVEVLARQDGSAQVRTADGTEGWVSAGYLTPDEPNSLKVPRLQEENEELQSALAGAREDLRIVREQLEQARAAATSEPEPGTEQTPGAEEPEEAAAFDQSGAISQSLLDTVSWRTWTAIIVFALLAGFGIGVWWLDRRIRRKYHGLRVY